MEDVFSDFEEKPIASASSLGHIWAVFVLGPCPGGKQERRTCIHYEPLLFLRCLSPCTWLGIQPFCWRKAKIAKQEPIFEYKCKPKIAPARTPLQESALERQESALERQVTFTVVLLGQGIAQVHRATLRPEFAADGQGLPVAVKVQNLRKNPWNLVYVCDLVCCHGLTANARWDVFFLSELLDC